MNLINQFINYVFCYFKLQEPEQRQQKCAQYWPDEETEGDQNGGMEFGNLSIQSRGEDLIDAELILLSLSHLSHIALRHNFCID